MGPVICYCSSGSALSSGPQYTIELDILAGIIFGGLLEKGRKLQLADINLAVSV